MKLSEMQEILSREQIQLTRSLGQNFLHDQNQVARILNLAALGATDDVIEIGPGLGPLTEKILKVARKVVAIEKDHRLVEVLKNRFANALNLEVLHADALEIIRDRRQWNEWKVVSNLPYSVASPILVEFAIAPGAPESIVVTLQSEVAARIRARPGTSDYGILSLLIQQRYEASEYFKIAAACFFPPPDVESTCIRLVRRVPGKLDPARREDFCKLVKSSFSQRRKMMMKLVKSTFPAVAWNQAFETVGISVTARAEEVSLEQFIQLTESAFGGKTGE